MSEWVDEEVSGWRKPSKQADCTIPWHHDQLSVMSESVDGSGGGGGDGDHYLQPNSRNRRTHFRNHLRTPLLPSVFFPSFCLLQLSFFTRNKVISVIFEFWKLIIMVHPHPHPHPHPTPTTTPNATKAHL